jgi:hypothetical protein
VSRDGDPKTSSHPRAGALGLRKAFPCPSQHAMGLLSHPGHDERRIAPQIQPFGEPIQGTAVASGHRFTGPRKAECVFDHADSSNHACVLTPTFVKGEAPQGPRLPAKRFSIMHLHTEANAISSMVRCFRKLAGSLERIKSKHL